MSFVPDDKPTELANPRDGSLDNPPSPIAAKLETILPLGFRSIGSVRADQVQTLLRHFISEFIAVVRLFYNQFDFAFRASRLLENLRSQLHLRGRGRVSGACNRYPLAMYHHHPLWPFSSFGFTHVVAPFFAGGDEV